MNPKISIVMSVYNGSKYLSSSVGSILNQSFSDFEFIVIDDTSTDNSLKIISDLAQKDSRIRIIKNEKNIGLTKSLNKAIREAKGEYIARIDVDDISYPDRLKLQVDFLDKNEKVALVGTWAEVIDASGSIQRVVKYPIASETLKKDLIKYNPFFHSSIMVRRKVLEEVGLYNEDFTFAQDYELYFRIIKKYEVSNIPAILIGYREIPNSITARKNRKQIGFVIKTQLKAIKDAQYSRFSYVYILKSILSWLLPIKLKKTFKKLFLS